MKLVKNVIFMNFMVFDCFPNNFLYLIRTSNRDFPLSMIWGRPGTSTDLVVDLKFHAILMVLRTVRTRCHRTFWVAPRPSVGTEDRSAAFHDASWPTGKSYPSTHLPNPARFGDFCVFRCGARIDDFHVVVPSDAIFISLHDKVQRPSATLLSYVRPYGLGSTGRPVLGAPGPRVSTIGNHLYSLSAYFHCIQPCCDPSPATLVASASQLVYRMRSSPSKVHTRIVS